MTRNASHQHGRRREAAEYQPVGESAFAGLDQREHEERQRGCEREEAEPVRAARPGIARFLQAGECDHEDRRADRQVDEEDPPPGQAGRECPTHDRPDRDREAGDGTPHAERNTPVLAAERVGQQRQRHGEHDRAADTLHAARDYEEQRSGRNAAQQRGNRERADPDQVHQPPAEQVGERSAGEQRGRQRQGVRVNDPLQIGEAAAQLLLDVGQGDVHDRDVEQQHERTQTHRRQRPPTVHGGVPASACCGCWA